MTTPMIKQLKSKDLSAYSGPFKVSVDSLDPHEAEAAQFNVRVKLLKQQHLMAKSTNVKKLTEMIDALEKFDAYNRKNEVVKQSEVGVGHVPSASVI